MVKIINYRKYEKENGDSFFSLELQGGIEMVQSQQTGQFYATVKRTFVTSTFDEETCKALIGTEIIGNIAKQECEPYEYTVRETGEVLILSHRYMYVPQENTSATENKPYEAVRDKEYTQRELAEHHAFSLNEELV